MKELGMSAAMMRNKIYTKLDKLVELNPEVLKKYDLHICGQCDGSGLANYHKMKTGDYSWDGVSFCSECDGTGYGPFERISDYIFEIFNEYFCQQCGGEGCKSCHNSGFVDWIRHARGE